MTKVPAIALSAVVIAGAGWYLSAAPQSAPGITSLAVSAQEAQDGAAEQESPQIMEMSRGNPDADVTVIEYASFTCPHCRTFHEEVMPQLEQEYIDSGRINFIYREVYFDRYGLWAGLIARCAGSEERYFGISDVIYERQGEWTQGEPSEIAQNLRRIGRTAGLSQDQLDSCLSDGAMAEALYAEFQQNAEADGITSTPSFVIDGETYRNMPFSEFQSILDEKLADAS